MTADCFIDSNVLIYSIDRTKENAAKREAAVALLETADFGLSTQVMQEFYVNATRKIRRPLAPDEALTMIERYAAFPFVSTDYSLVVEGIRNSVKHRLSYWDGAILAAAARLGANTLFTEDLNHGQDYDGIRAVNPFPG